MNETVPRSPTRKEDDAYGNCIGGDPLAGTDRHAEMSNMRRNRTVLKAKEPFRASENPGNQAPGGLHRLGGAVQAHRERSSSSKVFRAVRETTAARAAQEESAEFGTAGLARDGGAAKMRSTATMVPCLQWGQRVTSIPVQRSTSATTSRVLSAGGGGWPSNTRQRGNCSFLQRLLKKP